MLCYWSRHSRASRQISSILKPSSPVNGRDTKKDVRCIMFTLAKSVSRKGWRSAMTLGQLLWSQTRPTVWSVFRLHPYHDVGLLIPNRSVENTGQFLVLALLAAKKKPMLRPSVKAIAEMARRGIFSPRLTLHRCDFLIKMLCLPLLACIRFRPTSDTQSLDFNC